MKNHCRWCEKQRVELPSGVLVCLTCDVTPISTIPMLRKAQP